MENKLNPVDITKLEGLVEVRLLDLVQAFNDVMRKFKDREQAKNAGSGMAQGVPRQADQDNH